MHDWLSKWWQPLKKGGWHAPIVMVENKMISQGAALNRGVLTQAVIQAYSLQSEIQGILIANEQKVTSKKQILTIITKMLFVNQRI